MSETVGEQLLGDPRSEASRSLPDVDYARFAGRIGPEEIRAWDRALAGR